MLFFNNLCLSVSAKAMIQSIFWSTEFINRKFRKKNFRNYKLQTTSDIRVVIIKHSEPARLFYKENIYR